MKHRRIVVVNKGKSGRTPLADALVRAAIKVVTAQGDPAKASMEAVKIFRRASRDLKGAPGLEHFLEELRQGMRTADEYERRMRRREGMVVFEPLN